MKTFLFAICSFVLCVSAFATDKASVLVVESYHADYYWDVAYKKGLTTTLGNGIAISYYQMDTKRLPQSMYDTRAEIAWNTYQALLPDLVILCDDNALKYLGPKLQKTRTPVVFLGINNSIQNYFPQLPSTFTGVLERPSARRSIRLISQLTRSPSANILILLDTGTTSTAVIASTFDQKTRFTLLTSSVHIKQISSWERWQDEVTNAGTNGYTAVVAGLYHTITDRDGSHVDENIIIRWTSEHTAVPLFALYDFAVGPDKAVGGLVQSGEEHGTIAGLMAKRILSGEPPSAISVETPHKGRYLFSKTQLARYNLTLPTSIASQVELMD